METIRKALTLSAIAGLILCVGIVTTGCKDKKKAPTKKDVTKKVDETTKKKCCGTCKKGKEAAKKVEEGAKKVVEDIKKETEKK